MADALSRVRISAVTMPFVINFNWVAEEQRDDSDLKKILSLSVIQHSGFKAKGERAMSVYYSSSNRRIRIIYILDSFSHAGVKLTVKE